ncbi:hypothetical protein BPOR_0329g00030 [Botrytis porri]|uniref:Uncharacterized protein n=1 Tax=Botrytis porri TaxID=87229 RepID=A0A4Z1KLD8_9HELO|nr:hypothetical protein BPOR_0329g00030 [Botrytis porri]
MLTTANSADLSVALATRHSMNKLKWSEKREVRNTLLTALLPSFGVWNNHRKKKSRQLDVTSTGNKANISPAMSWRSATVETLFNKAEKEAVPWCTFVTYNSIIPSFQAIL